MPPASPMLCRLLTVDDHQIFRALRLRACKEEAAAFTEAYEELVLLPDEHFKRQLQQGWVAGAFAEEALVGLAGLYRHKGLKVRHKGTLWGVYVAPEARGQGTARRLMEMLLLEAEHAGLERVHLSTDAANAVTVALYESLGFKAWGIDKSFAKLPGVYVDEVMMTKSLHET